MGSDKSCSDLVSQCAEELGNVRRRHRRRVTDSEGKRSEEHSCWPSLECFFRHGKFWKEPSGQR